MTLMRNPVICPTCKGKCTDPEHPDCFCPMCAGEGTMDEAYLTKSIDVMIKTFDAGIAILRTQLAAMERDLEANAATLAASAQRVEWLGGNSSFPPTDTRYIQRLDHPSRCASAAQRTRKTRRSA